MCKYGLTTLSDLILCALLVLTLEVPGVCLYKIYDNLYEPPTTIESMLNLIYDIESIFSTTY